MKLLYVGSDLSPLPEENNAISDKALRYGQKYKWQQWIYKNGILWNQYYSTESVYNKTKQPKTSASFYYYTVLLSAAAKPRFAFDQAGYSPVSFII